MPGNLIDHHEAAKIFPAMSRDRFSELTASIKAHGLLHRIVLCENKILDGRHRYRACLDAGVTPSFTEYNGDPYAYVWTANGQRRDLGADQRYLVWAEIMYKAGQGKLVDDVLGRAAARIARFEATNLDNFVIGNDWKVHDQCLDEARRMVSEGIIKSKH
jgi:ParB-like chromosome segregation protein Spo0J